MKKVFTSSRLKLWLVILLAVLIFFVVGVSIAIAQTLADLQEIKASQDLVDRPLAPKIEEKEIVTKEPEKKTETKPAPTVEKKKVISAPKKINSSGEWIATVTGYNSLAAQTDSTPCVGAGGYICGRKDVVACPPALALGTWVQIDNKPYECMDRTHPRYGDRFDIFCDKDLSCPSSVSGKKKIFVLE